MDAMAERLQKLREERNAREKARIEKVSISIYYLDLFRLQSNINSIRFTTTHFTRLTAFYAPPLQRRCQGQQF